MGCGSLALRKGETGAPALAARGECEVWAPVFLGEKTGREPGLWGNRYARRYHDTTPSANDAGAPPGLDAAGRTLKER
jgi:hypothetical protein